MIYLKTREGSRHALTGLEIADAKVLEPYLKNASLVEVVEREIGAEPAKPARSPKPAKERRPRAVKNVDAPGGDAVAAVRAALSSTPRLVGDVAAEVGIKSARLIKIARALPGYCREGKTKGMKIWIAGEAV